jgi:glycosyltransferase involved in cell wall biosynthesis
VKLALATEIPAPYRIPLFNALADRLDLTVLFLRARNPERPYDLHEEEWRFAHRVLPGRDVTIGRRWLVLNRGVTDELVRIAPDVLLLGGWNQPAFWRAQRWAKRSGIPTLLWVESTPREPRARAFARARRRALQQADAFVVPGRASREYLEAEGVRSDAIFVAPNAVDPAIFGAVEHRPGSGTCRVLAVGRLAPEKGFDVLLRAVAGLPVDVTIAGTGPDEDRLRALAGANVTFLGHVDRDRLAQVYAEADVFVLPSLAEPWGMALNEAALAGLPLVASDAAGAAYDLVEGGVNGFRFPAGDAPALRAALEQLVRDPELARRMGAQSRALSLRVTPAAWADTVAAAAASATHRSTKSAVPS